MKMKTLLAAFFMLFSCQMFAQAVIETYTYGEDLREYTLYVPSIYETSNEAVPLILALHGLGDSNENFSNVGFHNVADTANAIVVTPEAVQSFLGTAWNNGANVAGIALNQGVDDVGFLSSLIDSMQARYHIDSTRIYVTGFSMGGMMTQKLACDLNHRVAAIASVAGTLPLLTSDDCAAERPIAVMHMHGTADGTISYTDGAFLGLNSVDATIDFWKNRLACNPMAEETALPDVANDGYTVDKFLYSDCDAEKEVLLYRINEGPHTWLSPSNDIFATEEIWNFLSSHTLSEVPEPIDTSAVGIADASLAKNVKVYPNPFDENLVIDIADANDILAINILNAVGQTVSSIEIKNNWSTRQSINTSDLMAGVYFVQIVGRNGKSDVLPVVKR